MITATGNSEKKVKPPLKVGVYLRTANGMTKVSIINTTKASTNCNSFLFILLAPFDSYGCLAIFLTVIILLLNLDYQPSKACRSEAHRG
jgi:hypothetical protein